MQLASVGGTVASQAWRALRGFAVPFWLLLLPWRAQAVFFIMMVVLVVVVVVASARETSRQHAGNARGSKPATCLSFLAVFWKDSLSLAFAFSGRRAALAHGA